MVPEHTKFRALTSVYSSLSLARIYIAVALAQVLCCEARMGIVGWGQCTNSMYSGTVLCTVSTVDAT